MGAQQIDIERQVAEDAVVGEEALQLRRAASRCVAKSSATSIVAVSTSSANQISRSTPVPTRASHIQRVISG